MVGSKYNAQIFRLGSSHETTSIPTRLDNTSGQHVVLWKDVLQYFKHAEGVLNEGKAVLFLTDDNFEYLTPLRIPHYPGVVLEVVASKASEDTVSTARDAPVLMEAPLQGPEDPFDPLPDIQDHIFSVVAQNYEPHQHQFPRLFIVLPKEVHGPNKIAKPFEGQFRLYFLCECGAHTMPEGCAAPHQVHLAGHKGYDIIKPTEFFERFGQYVLAQMYMVKYGFKATGLVVPPLETRSIVEGLNSAWGYLDYVKRNIASLVEDSIGFLEDWTRRGTDNLAADRGPMQMDRITARDGGDQGLLQRYLRIQDKDKGYGNLYAMVTTQGFVKWVCTNHYRQRYPSGFYEMLHEDLGEVVIKDHYSLELLCHTRFTLNRILKLTVMSGIFGDCTRWGELANIINQAGDDDSTMDETASLPSCEDASIPSNAYETPVRKSVLVNTITQAGVVELILHGSASRPTFDFATVLDLMSNGRLQTLRYLIERDGVTDLGLISPVRAPKMRVLEFRPVLDEESLVDKSVLQTMIESCPNLVQLGLDITQQRSVVKVMVLVITKLKKLERLELNYGYYCTTVDVSHGKIKALRMHLPNSRLSYFQAIKAWDKLDDALTLDHLGEILSANATVQHVTIGYRDGEPLDIINAVLEKQTIVHGTAMPCKLELVSVRSLRHTPPASITMEFSGNRMETEVKVGQLEPTDSAMYIHLFSNYGWSIRTLDIMNGSLDDGLARLLDKTTESRGSALRALGLDLRFLSYTGLKCIDRVLRRSRNFECLTLFCTTSDAQHERDKTKWLLARHSKVLTGLRLQAVSLDLLTVWLQQVFRTRDTLPNLLDLQLTLAGFPEGQDLHPYVQWLVGILSPPSSKSTHSSSSDSGMDIMPIASSSQSSGPSETFSSLKRLDLVGCWLRQGNWVRIVGAIDFSALEELDLRNTNFSRGALGVMVTCISNVNAAVPLQTVSLPGAQLAKLDNEMREVLKELQDKVFATIVL
ncbi:hypothetical protein BGX34_011249 [Mortierella sp. NVP85]|nr:hypothetical protein BGX34_011249 [Mortierella sp. NVP85]